MGAPWEKYKAQAPQGPWTKYQKQTTAPVDDETASGAAKDAGDSFNTFANSLTDVAVPFKGVMERAATYPAAVMSKLTGDKGSISDIADQMYQQGKDRNAAMEEKHPIANIAGTAVGVPALLAMPNFMPGGETGGKVGSALADYLGSGETASKILTGVGSAAGRTLGVAGLAGAENAIEGKNGMEAATRAGLTQGALEALPVVGKGISYLGNKVGVPLLKSISRVPGQYIDQYLERPDAVNAAVDEFHELKNPIDEAVAKYTGAKSQAQQDLMNASQAKDVERSSIMNKLKSLRPSEEVAGGIVSKLDESVPVISKMSDEAFGAIAGEKINVSSTLDKISELKNELKIGRSMPPKSSEEYGAYKKLEELENTIRAQIPQPNKAQQRAIELGQQVEDPQIIGSRAKKIVQVINNMTRSSYDKAAGEFNPIAAGKLKQLSGSLNEELYNIPAYQRAMQGLDSGGVSIGQKIGAKNDLSNYFGDIASAQKSMINIANQTPNGMEAKRAIDSYDKSFGTNIWDEIKGYVENKRLQKDPDAIESMLGKFNDEISSKQGALDEATAKADQLKKLGVGSTEGVVRTAMRGDPSRGIEGRKALENLGGLEGKDYLQDISDFGTKQAFKKGYPMGSAGTNLGWMLGKGIAGAGAGILAGEDSGHSASMGAIGGLLGAMSDKYGGPAAKAILDAAMKSQKLAGPLIEAAARGPVALQVTEALMNRDPEYRKIIQQNSP